MRVASLALKTLRACAGSESAAAGALSWPLAARSSHNHGAKALQHRVRQLASPSRLLSTPAGDKFNPTKLYQARAYPAPGDAAFKAAIGLNLAALIAAESSSSDVRASFLQHTRASVEAMYDGRYYTLATSMFSHVSVVHCAVNLLVLLALRRFQQLTNKEFILLYLLGGLGGSCAHVAYMWHDAGGPKYGPEFSMNTPGYMGCSGAVAAITAYKMFQQPLAMQMLVMLPLPVVLLQLFYVCLEVKEKSYFDGQPAKCGGTAVGIVLAVAAALLKLRTPVWLQR